ncbi:MAG: peptidoglycan-binding domain-containing protein [Acidobacteriota bacterium]
MASIARKYGFHDWKKIYDLPENSPLRQQRQHSEILNPGDEVFIPDKEIREYPRATEQRHKFKLKGPKATKLKIIVKDEKDQAFANKPYKLTLDEKLIFSGTTNGEGLLEADIPLTAERGILEIEGYKLPVRVSHLDPIDEMTGIQGRLHNLSYDCGPIDGNVSEKTVEAVKAFQEAVGLEPTGQIDEATKAKLKEKHGC